jgi:hypothetical protein
MTAARKESLKPQRMLNAAGVFLFTMTDQDNLIALLNIKEFSL